MSNAVLDRSPNRAALFDKRGQLFSQLRLAVLDLCAGFANELSPDRPNCEAGVIRLDDRLKEVIEFRIQSNADVSASEVTPRSL
jgi:hypothetical protein